MITYNIDEEDRKIYKYIYIYVAIIGSPIHEKLSTDTCLGFAKIYFSSLEKYQDAVY